jgi:plasmid maintenance system antidote protein VapI
VASQPNVLRCESAEEKSFGPLPGLFGRVSNDRYREAVAKIVSEIQDETGMDDEHLAEHLGVSEGTIANARNRRGNLDAVTMLNLGALFGGSTRLRRILSLVNGCPSEELSDADRIKRIRADLAALEARR